MGNFRNRWIGGGVVCPSANDCESGRNQNKLSLEVETGSDITISECDFEIELWQGKTNTLVCEATFSGLSDVGMLTRIMTINADYGYYVDKYTTVTITSR